MSAYDDAMKLVEWLRAYRTRPREEQAANMLEAFATTLHKWDVMPLNRVLLTEQEIRAVKAVLAEVHRGVEKMVASVTKVRSHEQISREFCQNMGVDPDKMVLVPDRGSMKVWELFARSIPKSTSQLVEPPPEGKPFDVMPKGMFTTEGEFEPSSGLGYNPDLVTVDMGRIGPIEVNAAGEITSITVTALEHLGAESCRTTDATTPKGQDGKACILPDLNGDIEYVAGPQKLRPMQSAPRDGSWIIVFYESGPADSPLECEVLRFSTELPKPFWLDRYSDACFSDGCAEMLGWLPIPVRE